LPHRRKAFVLEPATKRRFVVSNGGEMPAVYLRSLCEQGFSRRAELGKLIQGDMAATDRASSSSWASFPLWMYGAGFTHLHVIVEDIAPHGFGLI
jgi:hypothetical protein